MVYILDTNIIRKLFFQFPKKGKLFESVWDSLLKGIENGSFISVDECFNELERQFSKDVKAFNWINERKSMFKTPDNEESKILSDLFNNAKFRESIHKKNILENRPSADAYIVAKGKRLNATVVTAEELKPNSANLPNLCQALNVPCIGYDDFMAIVTESISLEKQ